jgi:hypothetical protein
MYASLSTFRGEGVELDPAGVAAGESMAAWLREFEGYLGLAILTNEETGMAYALTFWESSEAAEKSRLARTRMREQMAAAIGIEVLGNELCTVSFSDGFVPEGTA